MDADPFETLAPLVAAATVRIHAAPTGYDGGEPVTRPWGSGFFVAPNWVLTCAHVALRGGGGEGGGREVGLSVRGVERLLTGRVEWAQPEHNAAGGLWPAPDLALIRLLEPVPHPCVWLTERTARVFTQGEVAFFGCVETDEGIEDVSGRCSIRGERGSEGQMKLGGEDEVPEGVSGGPVVDLERGEVIGVLKARRSAGRDGGLATSVVQLRRLPLPADPVLDDHDDLYQRVLRGHDRYHADRHQDVADPGGTWTDAQSELRATTGRALTPGQRVELLGLLSQLPPPVSTRRLEESITALLGRPAFPSTLPAPRGWRDGLGLLYESRHGAGELETLLRYAMYAATADRPYPAAPDAEARLLDWVHRTAASAETPRWYRTNLHLEQDARLRERDARRFAAEPAEPDEWLYETDLTEGLVGAESEPFVLLEITPHGWERGRYDWRVCVAGPSGELTSIAEDFRARGPDEPPERLRAALAEAFRRGDEPDAPVPLHVAVPYSLLGFPVEEWRPVPGGPRLGEQRPVVVRCTDPVPEAEDSEELRTLRLARWTKVHVSRVIPDILDCVDNHPRPLPGPGVLISRDPASVPVLCHTPTTGGEPAALHRVMASGYNVILWRREITDREPDCGDFHRGVDRTVTGAGHAGRLPGALWRLRAAQAAQGGETPAASWARGLALLYADPGRPLPGMDEPLETP
ncbi:VMAP-C domain-containing protein [Streptomyces litchfieldiae]|nr:trypsin-like peptidase domain-containing protein [Streptomyces sp. DSM 44938]